jgi:tetratricopeptide (TPR) repeat protein
MQMQSSGFVEIVREFLLAYRRTREVAALHRSGELSFDVVRAWVGDDDSSALYRLKERCHQLFRREEQSGPAMEREALFDLTVGALFHEAMRFRESFYQQEIYGPRVLKLAGASEAELELMREFQRILAGASLRLDEALQETEALLQQTRRQFQGLLEANPHDGLVTRYLIEKAGYVALVFEEGLDALLARVHGEAASAYAAAARSYLDSGHFAEAARLLAEARARGGDRAAWLRLEDYASAMRAYLAGAYPEALASLSAWLDREPPADEAPYAALALDAVSHLGRLAGSDAEAGVAETRERLAARLQSVASAA